MSDAAPRTGVDWEAAYAYLQEQQESILLRLAERMEMLERHLRAARRGRIRTVELKAMDSGTLRSVIVADGASLTYAFHVFRDGQVVRKQEFGSSNTLQWEPAKAGSYTVKGFVRFGSSNEAPQAADSPVVAVTGHGVSG